MHMCMRSIFVSIAVSALHSDHLVSRDTKSPEYQVAVAVHSSLGDLVSRGADLLLRDTKSP